MRKKIYLSPGEQELFEIVKTMDFVTNKQLKKLFPKTKALNNVIHRLIKKGYFYKPIREKYIICKDRKLTIKPFETAQFLFNGYIAFSSALKIHGLLDYEPFTIFIATTNTSKTIQIGEYKFKAINIGRRAVGQTLKNNFYISTLEKTFFDCFFKPDICGYETITKALFSANINWNKFTEYFRKFASNSLCQRTGYLLNTMKKETKLKIPEKTLNFFKSKIKTKTRLVPSLYRKSLYNKEWKVQDNIGKEKFLSWWYHG
jgi:predicted transcriptional regulator of viral defense system